MNIKNIKTLEKIFPKDWHFRENFIAEDTETKEECIPYHFYTIPKVEDLISYITAHYSFIDIHSEFSDLGSVFHIVKVNFTIQDTIQKEFFSPFLDDALAEALIFLEGIEQEKKQLGK